MTNGHDRSNDQLSLPASWTNSLDTFALPQIMGPSTCESTTRQRTELAMPQWPSLLSNQSYTKFQSTNPQTKRSVQPRITRPLSTPVSAIPVVPSSTLRRTLTDLDREKICQYAKDNPSAKQSEIGGMFVKEYSA